MTKQLARVYLRGASVAHLLAGAGSGALCGMTPAIGLREAPWHGAGTERDRQRAAALPMCPRCEVRAA